MMPFIWPCLATFRKFRKNWSTHANKYNHWLRCHGVLFDGDALLACMWSKLCNIRLIWNLCNLDMRLQWSEWARAKHAELHEVQHLPTGCCLCVIYLMCQYSVFQIISRFTAWRASSSAPGQNGPHFADDIIRCIFVNEKFSILIKISLNVVPKGRIDNTRTLV